MSQPYLCNCGEIIDVEDIAPESGFKCPHCRASRQLDASDPALLGNFGGHDGRFNLLLKRKLPDDGAIERAEPVELEKLKKPKRVAVGQGVSETSTAPPPGFLGDTPAPAYSHPSDTNLQPGEVLGPFRIEGILGRGGMGTVFEAFDTSLQRTVALKVLADIHARNQELVDRFRREARAAGALTHPNITHIYSIGEDRGFHYFAMELVRGQTLSSILDDGRLLTEDQALDYLMQIARGLRAAKKKRIIHRDVKPSNLILSDEGLLKITDFGLAKVVTSPIDITATGVIIGTPLYMSPEQGKGEPLDHRSDIYSLGCSFYHMLCGRPPFSSDSAMNIIVSHITEEPAPLEDCGSSVGTRLTRLVHKMMNKSPLDRFQDYQQLIEGISQVQSPPGSGSSTQLEGTSGRIVLLTERRGELSPSNAMGLKQLSIADVNLELGRHDKALGLYKKVLDENPQLEVDLGFRILKISQQKGDTERCREWLERILATTDDPKERFYCRWKLLTEHLDQFDEALAGMAGTLQHLLEDELPPELNAKRLRTRLQEVTDLGRKLARERETGLLLIRKSGDLQIELD